MSSLDDELAKLESEFSQMQDDDERLSALAAMVDRMSVSDQPRRQVKLLPHSFNQPSAKSDSEAIISFAQKHGLNTLALPRKFLREPPEGMKYGSTYPPPLIRLACANQDVERQHFCPKNGSKPCAACRLVSYCSKECQVAHWKIHKQDCKNAVRSEKWLPRWCLEEREPAFMKAEDQSTEDQSKFGIPMSLFGNMPAVDVLNLVDNEGTTWHRDPALAFIASGDLRNVIRTVNSLPRDFDRGLDIIVNDHNPRTVCRNFLILTMFSTGDNIYEAAEYALHLWYSAFLPEAFLHRVFANQLSIVEAVFSEKSTVNLSERSTVQIHWGDETKAFFGKMMTELQMDVSEAHNAIMRTFMSTQRVDYREKFLWDKKPSHRVAYKEWWNFGIVSPFGAVNHHFNTPNRWMFNLENELCLEDFDIPLHGWNPSDVFEAGIKHGTTTEDIFGCLFFYVKDQLTEFARRLRTMKIRIHLFDLNARKLPAELRRLLLGPFDRIEVSNVTDHTYVGTQGVLEDWAPFLNQVNKHSAILALYMNWTGKVPEGRVKNASHLLDGLVTKYTERFPDIRTKILRTGGNPVHPEVIMFNHSLDPFYDNSPPFERYLKMETEDETVEKLKLTRRTRNKIVPHRLFARLGEESTTLPDVSTDERWYHITALCGSTLSERYVEWVRKD